MKPIHAMIAEDEQLAREELVYLLENEQDVLVCPSAETGDKLVELYVKHEPDIIFLDVAMPGLNGVDAAKHIMDLAYIHPPLFIFTTAYDDYAVKAFELEAIDYLMKPYDDARFKKAMKRVRVKMKQMDMNKEKYFRDRDMLSNSKLLIDDGERMVVMSPESIYFAVPSKRMLEIHTEDGVIESRMTLQDLEKKLQGLAFFRTHRSYLVNLNHVHEITPWFNGTSNVTLNDKHHTTLPVSRAARKLLFEIFEK